jgi:DNA-binding MarR family transcriptional regulator
MAADRDIESLAADAAAALRVSIGLLRRRLRDVQASGELTLPETSALARLDRGGPATSAALARLEQISPQSMGATLAGLESRGMIARAPDPVDGRRVILSITDAGVAVMRERRSARTQQLTEALMAGFTPAELEQLRIAAPLLERLAENL